MAVRPRHLALGLLVLVAAPWVPLARAADGSAPAPVLGSVVAGRAAGPFRATHLAEGRYRLRFAGPVDVDVVDWDADADVTILPQGDGAEVRFTASGRPVDSDFDVRATPEG